MQRCWIEVQHSLQTCRFGANRESNRARERCVPPSRQVCKLTSSSASSAMRTMRTMRTRRRAVLVTVKLDHPKTPGAREHEAFSPNPHRAVTFWDGGMT